MIATSVISEVERLLAEGKRSFRDVAHMTGVSRGAVARIARERCSAAGQEKAVQEEALGLELKAVHRARYEEVRRRRVDAGHSSSTDPGSEEPRGEA